jgi:hypothetical protein
MGDATALDSWVAARSEERGWTQSTGHECPCLARDRGTILPVMSKGPITGRQPRSRLERRVVAAQARVPDLLVIEPLNQWTCAGCGGSGSLLLMEDGEPLCMTCADLDHLVFLPAGDAALSRRARKASRLVAVVVRFSRSRKRYERQGILVEEAALQHAEAQCLADEDARARRHQRDRQRRADQDVVFEGQLAEAVARLFPGCPPERAAAIARFAAVRGSARIGRSWPGAHWMIGRSGSRWPPRCDTRTAATTSC